MLAPVTSGSWPGLSRHFRVVVPLFGGGVTAELAWQHGFYASALVAGLIALWIAGPLLARRMEPQSTGYEHERRSPVGDGSIISAERQRLQTMLDQVPAPLLGYDENGVLSALNKAARFLFRTDDRITPALPALRDAIAANTQGDRTVLKIASPQEGGVERSYALSVSSIITPAGLSRLGILTDIQAELHAREATALRDLLQVLGHEIMNSLTPVISLSETARSLLEDGTPEHAMQAREALETVVRRARGLDRFVTGYRALIRLPPAMMRPTVLSGLLRDAAMLFETRWHSQGVSLSVQFPEPDIIARLDADLLIQATLNLLSNAAEAALAGTDRPPRVLLSGFAHGTGLGIRVTDSGDGIPPDQADLVFRPFFTLRSGGTGIGLALARQIALEHGGSLNLEMPSIGRGASFLLTI